MSALFLGVAQFAEAAKCFAGEVEQHPDNDDAIRELGMTLARLGEEERAVEHLERLARRKPDDGRNWHALGFAYTAAKRPKDAERVLRRAIALPPEDVEEHRDLGSLLASQGRNAEARVEYRRALSASPNDPTTWLNLGNLERRAGRRDSAMACYRRAEARDSSFSLALQGQVQLLRERSRDVDAVEVYRRWLHAHPDAHGARLEAVRLLIALGRKDDALQWAREGVDKVGENGAPHEILGMVLQGRGDTRGAVAELYRAMRRFPTPSPDRDRARTLISALRSVAPDSMRATFDADSVRIFTRGR
jgi:tetratricopeptide (TPR) repeat protein